MNRQRSRWLATALVGVGVMTVPLVGNAASPQSAGGGGEIIDGGTFVGGPPEHIDPALNTTLDGYQVINALYDGLTDLDLSDPENPQIVPLLAESFESNEDATVWTFTIKEGMAVLQRRADPAEHVPALVGARRRPRRRLQLPAQLHRRWCRDASPVRRTPSPGVVADDEAMTLTVTMDAPYANFAAVAGFQTFFPMPEEAVEAGDQYENELMIGNGPYMLESPRSDEEIVLVRNESWAGDFNGETWPDRADRIVFRIFADPDTSYNALEAGETDIADIPPARAAEAQSNWGTTVDVEVNGSYHYQINHRRPRIGGAGEPRLLRQAISMAIDREAINESVYNGLRTIATGITPSGHPRLRREPLRLLRLRPGGGPGGVRRVAGGRQRAGDDPDPVQRRRRSRAGRGDHRRQPGGDRDRGRGRPADLGDLLLRDRRRRLRVLPFRLDHGLPDVRQLHVRPVPHRRPGRQQLRRTAIPEFDALVDEAKATTDPDAAAALFQRGRGAPAQRGGRRRSRSTGTSATYAFNPETLEGFRHGVRLPHPCGADHRHEVTP